jgi:hypothetical protein
MTGSEPFKRTQNSWVMSWSFEAVPSSSSYVSPVDHSSCWDGGSSDVLSSGETPASEALDFRKKFGSHDFGLLVSKAMVKDFKG